MEPSSRVTPGSSGKGQSPGQQCPSFWVTPSADTGSESRALRCCLYSFGCLSALWSVKLKVPGCGKVVHPVMDGVLAVRF